MNTDKGVVNQSSNIPPGWQLDAKTDFTMKNSWELLEAIIEVQYLCENICHLVLCVYIFDFNFFIDCTISFV